VKPREWKDPGPLGAVAPWGEKNCAVKLGPIEALYMLWPMCKYVRLMSTFNKDQHTGLQSERASDDDNACKCLIFQLTRPGHKPEQKLEAKLDWLTVSCKVNWAWYTAPEPSTSRRVVLAKHDFFLVNRESGPHKIGVHRDLLHAKHRLTWKLLAKEPHKHLHPWKFMYCRRHDIKALIKGKK